MKILIVDNNLHVKRYPQASIVRAQLAIGGAGSAIVRSPEELAERDLDVDRVILTGSTAYVRQEQEWMQTERRFLDGWMKRDVPVLGICFGAQLVARHLFGPECIVALPFALSGSISVRYRDGAPLFEGLPNPFGSITTHYEAFDVPAEHRIAEVEEWSSYAFAYSPTVLGVQFHPELMGPLGRTLVRIQRVLFDRNVYQDFDVPSSATHGRRLLANFVRGAT